MDVSKFIPKHLSIKKCQFCSIVLDESNRFEDRTICKGCKKMVDNFSKLSGKCICGAEIKGFSIKRYIERGMLCDDCLRKINASTNLQKI